MIWLHIFKTHSSGHVEKCAGGRSRVESAEVGCNQESIAVIQERDDDDLDQELISYFETHYIGRERPRFSNSQS